MIGEDTNSSQISEAKKKLREAAFSPKPVNVCEHIVNGKYSGRAFYVASQYMDDSYFIFWCCSECAKQHCIPDPGILVTDPELCEEFKIEGVVLKDALDEDANPYKKLLEENSEYFVARSYFDQKYGGIDQENVLNSQYKIPYGKEVEIIRK